MLDIQRRDHIDAGVKNQFYVEISLGPDGAGRVRVRELINEHDLRLAVDNSGDIHFLNCNVLMYCGNTRDDFKIANRSLRVRAAMCFDQPDYDIAPLVPDAM